MGIAERAWRGWLIAGVLAGTAFAGCGDDEGDDSEQQADGGDAGATRADGGDAGSVGIDGSLDAGLDAGRLPDGGAGLLDSGLGMGWRSDASISDKVVAVQISAVGHDGFQGVAYDSAGNIYAAGYTADGKSATADYAFVVAKFFADGGVDPGFGNQGIAIKNIAVGGRGVERARGIVVQPDGKIVVSGDVEHAVPAAGIDAGVFIGDSDLALVRFNADGTLDTSFGGDGVVQHNLNDAVETFSVNDAGMTTSSLAARDQSWNLGRTADGKLVVHASSRAAGDLPDGGPRTDSDFTLVRLNGDGELDPTFGSGGFVKTDFAQTNASARSATLLSDGAIVAAGYTRSSALGVDAQQPVLYKVSANGVPDATFGTSDPIAAPGVWHDFARADMKNAEAYGAALQGGKFVTVGYGPTPGTGTGTDWVFFRFQADGSPDRTFGVNGSTFLDPGGYGDNGRGGPIILPDGRIVGVGGGRPKASAPLAMGQSPQTDAMIAVLGPDGQLDESFAPGGFRLYNFGGQGDFFYGAALSPTQTQAVVAGVAGAVTDQLDDDAVLVLLGL